MNKWKILAVTTLLSLVLAACGSNEEATTDTPETNTEKTTEGTEKATETSAFPMTVASLTGEREDKEAGTKTVFEDVTLEEMPERIVTLDFGFLDNLDALGVEGVVGLPKSNLPADLKEKYSSDEYADLGTLKEIDFELVASLEPDVIFISGRQAPMYEQLKEITPNVIFVGSDNEDYIKGIKEGAELAGQIFDKEEEAKAINADLDAKVAELQEKAAGYENALVAMYNEKKIAGFDNGPDSRFAYVYNDFGFKPVTEDIESSAHGSDFSYESILSANPEVLLIIDRNANDDDALKTDIENDIIKQTRAYKEGKIVYLYGGNWYFASGGVPTEMEKIQEILDELK
ncbi:siderophore ABC transporter substrate-binding protein [Peribacillus sp. JNUCC 23]|uniref:siderophore ABC transporter substrate-binding protein n=1 Tax=Peribacillus sp. NPDC096379 TaxID=3364393 RepID=UPI0037F90E51